MKSLVKGSVLEEVVCHGFCIGCGACEVICPSNSLVVVWNDQKGLPQAIGRQKVSFCDKGCGICLQICPFSTSAKSSEKTSEELYSKTDGIRNHPEAGYWLQAYVGYAPDQNTRLSSASGGLVTFFLQALLRQGLITSAVCVGSSYVSNQEQPLFEYRICTDSAAISACSRSAYYPVSMSEVLQEIRKTPGRYAIVVLPCMAKALRCLCAVEPVLAERIVYVFGLVCGQVKTAHFSEFLAAKCGFSALQMINFRVKSPTYPNSNWGIRLIDESGVERTVNFSDIDRYWSDRFFTPMTCNLCTDVFAETTDAVFLDAWTPVLMNDWKGWSYALVRNPELRDFIERYISSFPEALKSVALDDVLASQDGVIVSKREDVRWRMGKAEREGKPQAKGCTAVLRRARWGRRLISEATYEISQASTDVWMQHRFDFKAFSRKMAWPQLKADLSRQVWRFSRVIELIMQKVKGFYIGKK